MAAILRGKTFDPPDLRRLLAEPPPEVRMIIEDATRVSDVAAYHQGLSNVSLPRHGVGYRVPLVGMVDGRWADAFFAARARSREFARFELDREKRTITFPREPDAPPTEIIDTLQRLDDLIYAANVIASR